MIGRDPLLCSLPSCINGAAPLPTCFGSSATGTRAGTAGSALGKYPFLTTWRGGAGFVSGAGWSSCAINIESEAWTVVPDVSRFSSPSCTYKVRPRVFCLDVGITWDTAGRALLWLLRNGWAPLTLVVRLGRLCWFIGGLETGSVDCDSGAVWKLASVEV